MARTLKIVLDCADPSALAPFWAGALGYRVVGSVDNYTLLAPAGDADPPLLLQRVSEPKAAKNRMHLDITCADVPGEVARLEALGATRAPEVMSEHGSTWIVLGDPEGNEFCVCAGAGEPGS